MAKVLSCKRFVDITKYLGGVFCQILFFPVARMENVKGCTVTFIHKI